ncbi:hypothetical protein E2C01_061718 [Portunus trituberculatus]|uniref:Uncharacterized protein n=1 Tax=Portunus trituberculatus TaxID=210409 RepID=A0A5B7H4L6_PORTR|nr:hypothetical protein [Portunus trituberculatus]
MVRVLVVLRGGYPWGFRMQGGGDRPLVVSKQLARYTREADESTQGHEEETQAREEERGAGTKSMYGVKDV